MKIGQYNRRRLSCGTLCSWKWWQLDAAQICVVVWRRSRRPHGQEKTIEGRHSLSFILAAVCLFSPHSIILFRQVPPPPRALQNPAVCCTFGDVESDDENVTWPSQLKCRYKTSKHTTWSHICERAESDFGWEKSFKRKYLIARNLIGETWLYLSIIKPTVFIQVCSSHQLESLTRTLKTGLVYPQMHLQKVSDSHHWPAWQSSIVLLVPCLYCKYCFHLVVNTGLSPTGY